MCPFNRRRSASGSWGGFAHTPPAVNVNKRMNMPTPSLFIITMGKMDLKWLIQSRQIHAQKFSFSRLLDGVAQSFPSRARILEATVRHVVDAKCRNVAHNHSSTTASSIIWISVRELLRE